MEKIKKVKLSLNSEAEVVVVADIKMHGKLDTDDIYFVMFNILHNPLRFVVATVGDFAGILLQQGHSKTRVLDWLANNPEEFMSKVLNNQEVLFGAAKEKVRVILDAQKNANMARAVVASMIDKGFYWQQSNYWVDGVMSEPKMQQVPTKELMLDLNQMLNIIKSWETFDLREFLMEQGATKEQVDNMMEAQA
jgi:hypothetical protein